MLVTGEGAARYAEILAGPRHPGHDPAGQRRDASSRKLLRSVFYKGLAAAVVEALAAADEQTIDRLVDGTHRHARRRVDEMTAAAEQVTELGVRTRIAATAHD
jgi:hypothetical protein